ncbi:GAF and ANTAR domain-containing protein [Cellulomonas cellasea]|uniref:GAF domain-containing protein n=1 Tax=Cellulomonas cellasea TaxID=43670 RepID=A0A7W4UCM8_9CELL|nr:GAF and ANTAR domain-containing protein [Cellulomonas cellasea]MBB2921726.1 GAF domain-containing protein [Cellulomonas cellasea]
MAPEVPAGDQLMTVFARMGGLLLSEDTVGSTLTLLTSVATHAVPRAAGAGVTLTGAGGGRQSVAASDALVLTADTLQYQLDEGPCLAAWAERAVVRADDLGTEDRWPRWTPAARAAGVHAVVSTPLVAGDAAVGALKVYSTSPGAFTAGDEHVLALLAAQAAVLVTNVQSYRRAGRLGEDLRATLRRRDVVNQAKGVVMGRDGTTEEAAFAHLLALAHRDGVSVHDAATRLVASAHRRTR